MKPVVLYILFLFFGWFNPVRAQQVRSISTDEGLLYTTVNGVEKDVEGLIWIGTKNGLYKYNEGVAEEVRFNALNPRKNIQTIRYTTDGILLIGLQQGGLIEFDTRLKCIRKPSSLPLFDSTKTVSAIFEDNSGRIWIGTISDGIYYSTRNQSGWERLKILQDPDEEFSCFDFDQQGDTIWIAASGDKIFYYLYSTDRVYEVDDCPYYFNSFRKTVAVNGSRVAFSIESLGVLEYMNDEWSLHPHPSRDVAYHNEQLWMSTDGDGIWIWDGLSYQNLTKKQPNSVLITDQFYGISIINDVLWIGSYNGGLTIIETVEPGTRHIPIPDFPNLQAVNSAISILVKDDLTLIGYDGEGAYKYQNGVLEPFGNLDARPAVVTSLLAVDNEIWMGTHTEGLWIYNNEGQIIRKFHPYQSNSNGLINAGIWSLEQGLGDTIWVGTLEGLEFWDGSSFYKYDLSENNKSSGVIVDIHQYQTHTWIAQANDLTRIGRGVDIHFSFDYPIIDIHHFGKDLLVGTEGGGIYSIDLQTNRIKKLKHHETLSVHAIKTIEDRCFMIGNNGLFELKKQDTLYSFLEIAKTKELEIGEFNREVLSYNNRELLIGGTRGLFAYNLDQKAKALPTRILIDKIFIDDSILAPQYYLQAQDADYSLTLLNDQATIYFHFELVSPNVKTQMPVEYVLDGTLVDISKDNRSFSITNLSPGKHELKIQLKNYDGIVTDSIQFEINKKAKIWKYPAFQMISSIGLLFLIASTLVVHERKRKADVRLKLLETEKELLASKANESKALLDKRNTELEFQLIKTTNRIEILNEFKVKFKELSLLSKSSVNFDSKLSEIKRKIDREIKNEIYWDELQDKYYRINENLVYEIKKKYPQLTKGDIDFILLSLKNLTSKEIATILNITIYAVRKRKYRIKKKMNLDDSDDYLKQFIKK